MQVLLPHIEKRRGRLERVFSQITIRRLIRSPENCARSKFRRLDRYYEFCSKKNGNKLFLNSSRCFVTTDGIVWKICICPLPGYEGSYFAFESSTTNCILAFVQGKDKLKIAFLTLRCTIDESFLSLKGTVEKNC